MAENLTWNDTDKIATILREKFPDIPPVVWTDDELLKDIKDAGIILTEPPNKSYLAAIQSKMIEMWHDVDSVPTSFHENNRENIDEEKYPDDWMTK